MRLPDHGGLLQRLRGPFDDGQADLLLDALRERDLYQLDHYRRLRRRLRVLAFAVLLETALVIWLAIAQAVA
jgi:hypothetical protein